MGIKGKVEIFTPRTIVGWLAILGDCLERPQLEALLDGVVLATATADEYRQDVASKGLGDGRCQFRIIFPNALNSEEMKRLRLRIVASEVFLELPRLMVRQERILLPATSGVPSPIFIVGSPRSGTTVLACALASVGYHGFGEGNFIGLSQVVDQQVDLYLVRRNINNTDHLLGNVNIPDLKNRLFFVFKEILEQLNPQEPWFDKTGNPETILILPRIMDAWPCSKVIFAKRHGVENVVSRLIKFPKYDFAYHCRDWANNMRAWRMMRGQLDPSRIVELEQKDFVEAPDIVAEKLAAFLEFSDEKKRIVENIFRTERPQESFPGGAAKKLRIRNAGWTPEQVKIFDKLCGEEMNFFGYQQE